jgi:predicted DNA-binding protein
MLTIRLPDNEETRLNIISANEKTTKSEIVKRALRLYFKNYFEKASPFELGKDLFGKYGSETGNLSADYKKKLKEKLRAKNSH